MSYKYVFITNKMKKIQLITKTTNISYLKFIIPIETGFAKILAKKRLETLLSLERMKIE